MDSTCVENQGMMRLLQPPDGFSLEVENFDM